MAQSLPQFVNPGDAAGQALTDFLVQQQQMKQQKLLNDVAQQRLQLDREREARLSRSEELTIAEQRIRNKRLEHESEKADIIDYRNDLVPGDFVDPTMMTRAQKAGIALPSQKAPDTVVPAQPDTAIPGAMMPSGAPAPSLPLPGATEVRTPGGVKFLGTPKQRMDETAKGKIQSLIDTFPPGSSERVALEYELATGRNAPAGLLKTPGSDGSERIFRSSPNHKDKIEEFVEGRWVPFAGSALPPHNKFLQETNPAQPGVFLLPTDEGYLRAPRTGGPATPVVGPGGKPVMPRARSAAKVDETKLSPAQLVAYKDIVKRKTAEATHLFPSLFGSGIDDATSEQIHQEAYDEAKKIGATAPGGGTTAASGPLGTILDKLNKRAQ